MKLLLEAALVEANKKREEKILKGAVCSSPSPEHGGIDDDESEVLLLLASNFIGAH